MIDRMGRETSDKHFALLKNAGETQYIVHPNPVR